MTPVLSRMGWCLPTLAHRSTVMLAALTALLLLPNLSWALETYSFTCITGNNATNCGIGEAQLSMEVYGPSDTNPFSITVDSDQVLFVFKNTGSNASSITDVYFDDGTLLSIASVHNGTGVAFSQGASPPDLPGGNNVVPPFVTSVGFSADSDPPAQTNGVNPGEVVGILFDLQTGKTYTDVITALNTDANSPGTLRVGIHVQGFASGGSESFVTGGGGNIQVIPEPASAILLGLGGLGFAGWFARKRRQTAK